MDNRVNWKIPLDLGFRVREGVRRTGQRTPTGSGKRVLGKPSSEVGTGKTDHRPRGESGFGTGREATRPGVTGLRFAGGHGHRGTLPGIELAGSPVGHEHGGNRPISTGHPNCSAEAGRRRRTEGTGNRVSVKVSEGPRAGLPVTGPPGNGGRFADQTESVWRSSRACSDRAPTLATGPQATAAIGSGFRQRAVGQPTGTGLEKRHCPPHPSGHDGQCEVEPKASARRSTDGGSPHLGRPREGAPASAGCTTRGLSLSRNAPTGAVPFLGS